MPGINQILDSFVVRAANGPLHPFTFRSGHGFRGREVEELLHGHGIRIFERTRVGRGEYGFSVRREQARWAEYLLCREGVPLTCELLDPRNEILLRGEKRTPPSLLARVLDALARIAGD